MLYIDCSHTTAQPQYTGIQRYVRHTLRQSHHLLGSSRVRALHIAHTGWACMPGLAAHPLEGLPPLVLEPKQPVFDEHSQVLLADRFWHTAAWDALDMLLASPAQVTVVVYDLLSLQQPAWFPAGVGERFERYLRLVLPRADRIVCLSCAVGAELGQWMGQRNIAGTHVHVVPPGHQVWHGAPHAPPSLPETWRDGKVPFVLQVGTLEPRKNHVLTLAALQREWDTGRELGCLFIGQRGWMMDSFLESTSRLPQWQRQLLWLSECPDAQLDWCYRHAAAVVYPSACEGYGLPLAEAACAGAPVIATDTPAHREVVRQLPAGSRVRLCAANAAALGRTLHETLAQPRAPLARVQARGWRAATAELLAAIGAPSVVAA